MDRVPDQHTVDQSPSESWASRSFVFWWRRYQRTRLYTRVALGKARAMDVVSGESSGNFGQLVLLYPLLFWLQVDRPRDGYLT